MRIQAFDNGDNWPQFHVGSAVMKPLKAIADFGLRILTYRSRRLRASQERQRQLSEFWKSEQERLWPMLRGSFEKVENWDSWWQLFAFAERLQSFGMTVNQVNEALSASGHRLACDGKVFIPPLNTESTISYVYK